MDYYEYLKSQGLTGSLETTFAVPPDWPELQTSLIPAAPSGNSVVPVGGDPWGAMDGTQPEPVFGVGSGGQASLAAFSGVDWSWVAAAVIVFIQRGNVGKAIALLKSLFGRTWFRVVLALVGVGILSLGVAKLLDRGRKKTHRRYSIGANPRLQTLLKVAKRVDNIMIAYDRRVGKFRTRIRGGRRYGRSPVVYAGGRAKRDITVVR